MATKTDIRSVAAPAVSRQAPTLPHPTLVSRPLGGLEPRELDGRLPAAAESDLAYLQFLVASDDIRIARGLVDYSLQITSRVAGPLRRPPAVSILNRRRRSARLWVNAVLAGDVSQRTMDCLTGSWLPHLAGVGPDASQAAHRLGFRAIEWLRGAFQASIFDRPDANLVRHARALHALETVLAAHAAAVTRVATV